MTIGTKIPDALVALRVEREILARDPFAMQFLHDAANKAFREDPAGSLRGSDGISRAWLTAVIDTLVVHGFKITQGPAPADAQLPSNYRTNLVTLASRRKNNKPEGGGAPTPASL